MRELKVGDSVRSWEGVTGTVMVREHNFEFPRYVIACDDGGGKQTINPFVIHSGFLMARSIRTIRDLSTSVKHSSCTDWPMLLRFSIAQLSALRYSP